MKLLQEKAKKWNVSTSNWECVCSGLYDEQGFGMTKRTAAWSLGMVFFRGSQQHEKSNGNHV